MASKHELKKHYNAYSRYILAEILSKKQLNILDKIYSQARIKTTFKNLLKQMK